MVKQEEKILSYWFGDIKHTVAPSQQRAILWFGESEQARLEMTSCFINDYKLALAGEYDDWGQTSRGQLALILLLDQVPRHLFWGEADAYEGDSKALGICNAGVEAAFDRRLSLIERVFYYFPLLHAESTALQEKSLIYYQDIIRLALPETQAIYDSFYKFALHHHDLISRFGRFPHRNDALSRHSSTEEKNYLRDQQ